MCFQALPSTNESDNGGSLAMENLDDTLTGFSQTVDLGEWMPPAQPASPPCVQETPSVAVLPGPPSSDVLSDPPPVRGNRAIEYTAPAFDSSTYGLWGAQSYPPPFMPPHMPAPALGDPLSPFREPSPAAEILFDPWRVRAPMFNVPQCCIQILLDQVIRSVQHLELHHAGHGPWGSSCRCRSFVHVYYMLTRASSLVSYVS